MSDPSVQFLTLVVQTVGTLGVAWIAYKTALITKGQAAVQSKIGELEKNTNSIKDELVRVTRESAHAQGVLDQKATQRAKDFDRAQGAQQEQRRQEDVAAAVSHSDEPVKP